jgi:hypothetical protein
MTPKFSSFVEESKVLLEYILVWNKKLVEFYAHLTLHKIGKESNLVIKFTFLIELLWLFFLNILKFNLIFIVFLFLYDSVILFFVYGHFFGKHSCKHVSRATTLSDLLGISHIFKNVFLIFVSLLFNFLFFIFVVLLKIVHFVDVEQF